jgi:hypothetical protein
MRFQVSSLACGIIAGSNALPPLPARWMLVQVRMEVANRRYTLEMIAYRAQGGLLSAPAPSGMDRRIAETLDASVAVRLSQRGSRGSQILFEDEGRNAGLEAVGDLDHLRQMLFHIQRR